MDGWMDGWMMLISSVFDGDADDGDDEDDDAIPQFSE